MDIEGAEENLKKFRKSVNKPVIVLLNMCDKLKSAGVSIDGKLLERLIGYPVVLTSVKKNIGVSTLLDTIEKTDRRKISQKVPLTAKERFDEAEKICFSVVKGRKSPSIGRLIDKIVLNRFLAVPIFAAGCCPRSAALPP